MSYKAGTVVEYSHKGKVYHLPSVWLQGIGWVPAKQAKDLHEGDVEQRNYGATYTLSGIHHVGGWVVYTMTSRSGRDKGTQYENKRKPNTFVPLDPISFVEAVRNPSRSFVAPNPSSVPNTAMVGSRRLARKKSTLTPYPAEILGESYHPKAVVPVGISGEDLYGKVYLSRPIDGYTPLSSAESAAVAKLFRSGRRNPAARMVGKHRNPRVSKLNQRGYTHYVVDTRTGMIATGWYYPEDAKDAIKEMLIDAPTARGKLKVYTKQTLVRQGVSPDSNDNWAEIVEFQR